MGEEVQEKESKLNRDTDPQVIALRTRLFNELIIPYKKMVYWLCIKYSDESANIPENFSAALTDLFRGIETYDVERPIRAWIHTVVRHCVQNSNKRRSKERNLRNRDYDAFSLADSQPARDEPSYKEMTLDNWRNMYSDQMIAALDSMKPIYRDALLLQMAGYSMAEIAEVEYKKGVLPTPNIDTIKSRLFLARKYMRDNITRDGKQRDRQTD